MHAERQIDASTTNASVWFTAPRTVEVKKQPVPQPSADEVLVRSSLSGISAGTEGLIYRGEAPSSAAADATIEALSGTLSYPLRYGYCSVGQIVDTGAAVSSDWQGRRVFAFHPHARWYTARPDDLIRLPDGISDEEAIFLPSMETAITLVMDAQPMIGARVAVFGQGIIGLLTTTLLSTYPLERLVAIEPRADRRKRATRLGAHGAESPESLEERSDRESPFDLCIECSGEPAALNQAIRVCGFEGRIVVGSWYGTKPAALNLGGRFHRQRLQLVSSQVSTIASRFRGRWSKDRVRELALDAIAQHTPADLITHRYPVEEAAQA
ncbi:MAG: zinc-binding dehydrogenase, partial [Bacteroidetes bacterium]|nr:zinc-binding dehydrogenase [Bacteroidota bacterium]